MAIQLRDLKASMLKEMIHANLKVFTDYDRGLRVFI